MSSIPFSKIKLLISIEHEDKKFKKGEPGLALLQSELEKKNKFPVWLHGVKYPVYLKKAEFEIAYQNPVGQHNNVVKKKK